MRPQYRQGDVFLLEIERLPDEARKEAVPDRIVLAFGEVTGHSHSVKKSDAQLYKVLDQNYLVVDSHAQVVHEEHKPIDLPGGVYLVVRQREYEPIRGIEYVSD